VQGVVEAGERKELEKEDDVREEEEKEKEEEEKKKKKNEEDEEKEEGEEKEKKNEEENEEKEEDDEEMIMVIMMMMKPRRGLLDPEDEVITIFRNFVNYLSHPETLAPSATLPRELQISESHCVKVYFANNTVRN
jgi:hypothetical protein